jgi:hypothetical protein
MTNKELLSQMIDRYEREYGTILAFTEETTNVHCKLTVKFPSGKLFHVKKPRGRMLKEAPPMYHDELKELAYAGMIELLVSLDQKDLKD